PAIRAPSRKIPQAVPSLWYETAPLERASRSSRDNAASQDRPKRQTEGELRPGSLHTRQSAGSAASARSRLCSAAYGVSDTPNGANQLVLVPIIHFAAQTADVNINNVGDAVEALVPDMFDDHRSRQNPAGIGHQVFKESVFFQCEFNASACALHLLRQTIEFKVVHPNHAAASCRAAPQQRFR